MHVDCHSYPFWSRSNGADHFYICAHEIGAGIGDGVLKNAIALLNTADYSDPYFIPHKVRCKWDAVKYSKHLLSASRMARKLETADNFRMS